MSRSNHRFSLFASVVLAGVAGTMACSTAHPVPTAGSGGFAAPANDTKSATATATADASAGGASASVSDASTTDAAADGGAATSPIDASVRPDTHTDNLCDVAPIGWWTTSASIDTSVSAPAFGAALAALLALPNAHPITLAETIAEVGGSEPAGWRFKATASLTNGIGQQYFPFDHPAAWVTAARSSTAVGTGEHEASAWLHVVDGAGADVWLPLADVDVHASVPDSYCAHLGDGVLTATLPHTASAISMTLIDGTVTNLAGLLGAEGPAGGWLLRMTFEAEKVQISLK